MKFHSKFRQTLVWNFIKLFDRNLIKIFFGNFIKMRSPRESRDFAVHSAFQRVHKPKETL